MPPGTVCVLADFADAALCLDLEPHSLASKLPGYNEATLAYMGINFDGKTCMMIKICSQLPREMPKGLHTLLCRKFTVGAIRLPGWRMSLSTTYCPTT